MVSHEVIESFLTATEANELMSAMASSKQAPASVLIAGREVVDEIRRASVCCQMDAPRALIEERLSSLKQYVEDRFALKLIGPAETSFVIYRAGDGFGKHVDVEPINQLPVALSCRRLSAVIFLNPEEST